MRWPNSGRILEPVQFSAQLHHVADDGDGGRRNFFFRRKLRNCRQRAGDGFLPAGRAAMDDGHRRFRRHAVRDERFRPVGEIVHAHQHDLGAGDFGDLFVAQRRGCVRRIAVAGEDREAGAMLAVRERNARVIRRRHDGRNAGHDFERDFFRRELLGFLAAATENERVAALEPHDGFALAGAGEHEFGELFLREAAVALVVAARNDFGGRRGEPQQFGIDQHVADDHFGEPEQFRAAQREQAGVARPRAHQINCAFGFHADNLSECERRAMLEAERNCFSHRFGTD